MHTKSNQHKKQTVLSLSCNKAVARMEIDVVRYCVLSCLHVCRDGASVNATPIMSGPNVLPKGTTCMRWKMFALVFISPPFQSKPYRMPGASRVALISL